MWGVNLPHSTETPSLNIDFNAPRYDRLRLLQVPSGVIPAVRDCVNNFWYLRLLKQREYHGTTEFKLGGCPWWAEGNDAIESR